MPSERQMGKMWYIHGIVFNFKKEDLVTCYDMDEPQGHYAM